MEYISETKITGKAMQEAFLPVRMSDLVRTQLLPKPSEVATLGDIILEFDDIRAFFDLPVEFLNLDKGVGRHTD